MRRTVRILAGCVGLAAAVATTARADDVRLEDGATIRAVTVGTVGPERVVFRDPRGRIDERPLSIVSAVSIDACPAISRAESLLDSGAVDAAVRMLAGTLAALPAHDPAAAWIRVRLLRVHAARAEATLARAHLLALIATWPDPAWGRLEPAGGDGAQLDAGALAVAAREARAMLRRARAVAGDGRVDALLDRLAARLPPADEGQESNTISGIAVSIPAPSAPQAAEEAAEPGVAEEAETTAPDEPSLEAIDALLRGGRGDEAIVACERALGASPRAPSPALLRAYGTALERSGRIEDALLAFLRVGVLHERSRHAAPCLVEAADLYVRLFGDRVAAGRLAARAEALARDDDARAAARAARTRHDPAP